MLIPFFKYHGTGNDFVVINNTSGEFDKLTNEDIHYICKRHIGVGADGLILLSRSFRHDFKMQYFNSDGKLGSMCGNGGRCASAFAKLEGLIGENAVFETNDGIHTACVDENNNVLLSLNDVENINKLSDNRYYLDTGSPHYVEFVNECLDKNKFKEKAVKIRNDKSINEAGCNVNFVKIEDDTLKVLTFERGVEDYTLSCGTGVTAAALAYASFSNKNKESVETNIITAGGSLKVFFKVNEGLFSDIFLSGPATPVFSGVITL